MQMIKSGEIKNDTKIRVIYGCHNPIYVFDGDCFREKVTYKEMGVSILLSDKDFEILEDTTEEIEELYLEKDYILNDSIDREIQYKINELVRAVNKLNKQDTSKETNCMSE